jgi:hypothetical protein
MKSRIKDKLAQARDQSTIRSWEIGRLCFEFVSNLEEIASLSPSRQVKSEARQVAAEARAQLDSLMGLSPLIEALGPGRLLLGSLISVAYEDPFHPVADHVLKLVNMSVADFDSLEVHPVFIAAWSLMLRVEVGLGIPRDQDGFLQLLRDELITLRKNTIEPRDRELTDFDDKSIERIPDSMNQASSEVRYLLKIGRKTFPSSCFERVPCGRLIWKGRKLAPCKLVSAK